MVTIRFYPEDGEPFVLKAAHIKGPETKYSIKATDFLDEYAYLEAKQDHYMNLIGEYQNHAQLNGLLPLSLYNFECFVDCRRHIFKVNEYEDYEKIAQSLMHMAGMIHTLKKHPNTEVTIE